MEDISTAPLWLEGSGTGTRGGRQRSGDRDGADEARRKRSGDGDGANEARSPPTVTPQAASAGGGGGGGDGRNRK